MATATASDQMFSFKMTRDLYDRLSRYADRERRSKGFVARDALDAYLAAHESTQDSGNSTDDGGGSGEIS